VRPKPARRDLQLVVGDAAAALKRLRVLQTREPVDGEVSIERNSAILHVLLAAERAFMMFLREVGDPGFHARNPQVEAKAREMVLFVLKNGQADQYPLATTYPVADAFRTMAMFVATGRVPEDIGWHNDSGDRKSTPNA